MNYERSHSHADTLYPRDLWDRSQADLASLDGLLSELAARHAVTLIQPSGKHPAPTRELIRKGHSETRAVRLYRDYPGTPGDGPEEPLYVLGVMTALPTEYCEDALNVRGIRSAHPSESWVEVGRYPSTSVRLVDSTLRSALEAAAARAFGPTSK